MKSHGFWTSRGLLVDDGLFRHGAAVDAFASTLVQQLLVGHVHLHRDQILATKVKTHRKTSRNMQKEGKKKAKRWPKESRNRSKCHRFCSFTFSFLPLTGHLVTASTSCFQREIRKPFHASTGTVPGFRATKCGPSPLPTGLRPSKKPSADLNPPGAGWGRG